MKQQMAGGTRGPSPTPTDKLAPCSWRRDGRKNEPRPPKRAPPRPRWLSKEAKAVFARTCRLLEKVGTLHETDGNAIARYSVIWCRWRAAAVFIEQYGESYPMYATDKEGNTVYVERDGKSVPVVKHWAQFPQVATFKALNNDLLRLEQEFGLTPASRTRLQVEGPAVPGSSTLRFFRKRA